MVRIFMVRHGQAAATFTDDPDPGLSDLGRRQASQVAEQLRPRRLPDIWSSPLKRAFETARALQQIQGGDIRIEPRISEIPSRGLTVEERGPWLRKVMTGNWSGQSSELRDWRQTLVDCLLAQQEDCVLFSHFVAINVAVGRAEDQDAVSIFRPDNTSVTELATDGTKLHLVRRGSEAVTRVN